MDNAALIRDLLTKVRSVDIRLRRLVEASLAGSHPSAFKGQGLEFEELRAYCPGDDFRSIDWNVTARMGVPHVKVFKEEHELYLLLIVDVSGSANYGTHSRFKRRTAAEIAATIAYSVAESNDHVGLLLFSDGPELHIPFEKGKGQFLRILRELATYRSRKHGTSLGRALDFVSRQVNQPSVLFLMSDFQSVPFEHQLRLVNARHEVMALQIFDPSERDLPDMGLITLQDPESANQILINSGSQRVREAYRTKFDERQTALENCFVSMGIQFLKVESGDDCVSVLRRLFGR